jgi:hypothetical protein
MVGSIGAHAGDLHHIVATNGHVVYKFLFVPVVEKRNIKRQMRDRKTVVIAKYFAAFVEVDDEVGHSVLVVSFGIPKATRSAVASPWDFAGDFPGFQGIWFLSVKPNIFFHVFLILALKWLASCST